MTHFRRRGSGGAQTCGVIPVMPTPDILTEVRAALESIVDSLDGARFVIPGERRDLGEPARDGVVQTVRQYLLPRLREPDAPVVAALVGLSGVGKSTILNSLAQERISPTGVLRPTTTNGVLWAHRSHAARYWTEFVGRVTEQIGPTTDIVIGDDPITRHLTFIDTPPVGTAPRGKGSDGRAESDVRRYMHFRDVGSAVWRSSAFRVSRRGKIPRYSDTFRSQSLAARSRFTSRDSR